MRDTLISVHAVAGLSALVVSVLGVRLVGRPISKLTEGARRIGAGDLSERLRFAQDDELGELAA